jgi:hypothetical protein
MASPELIKEMVDKINAFEMEINNLKMENKTLMKLQAIGGGGGHHQSRRGLIDVKELARMETLSDEKQWADWSTRFKDAIMARGHPAARCALDAMEQISEKDAGAPKGAEVARSKMLDWSAEQIDDQKWRMWANDLYYILEDMTKGNATVVVRNSVITNGGPGIIEQDGFRAWRGLKVAMNPKTPARRLQSFMEVVQCSEVKDKREVNTVINNWLRRVARLQSEFKETLSASLRTALLISMLPKDMQVSALQQVDMKDDTEDEVLREGVFKDIIDKVRSVINSEISRATPTPMEGVTIGSLGAGGHECGQGDWYSHEGDWGNGPGYFEDPEIMAVNNGECFSCGQKGHRAAECPAKGGGKGTSLGNGGKGPTGFQKGYNTKGGWHKGYNEKGSFGMTPKGFGKGQWEAPRRRACFGCGSLDHLQRNCPKNIGQVEEVEVLNVSSRSFEDDDIIVIGMIEEGAKFGYPVKKKKRVYKKMNPDERKKEEPKLEVNNMFGEIAEKEGEPILGMKEYNFMEKNIIVEVEDISVCAVGAGEETVVGLTFQATDVKKALAAVWRVCEKGNLIQFGEEPEDCFIKNKKTNRKIFMRKKKGSYVLDVEFVIKKDGELISLGKGEITIDSAAEESVCPHDWGGAFPLKESKKRMNFKTASGQDMQHYGERVVTCITQSRPAQGFPRHP